MLPIFPASYFDELFSSRVGRSHRLRGHKSQSRTYKELFDSVPFVLSLWVPQGIDVLSKKLPGNHFENFKSILSENTLFPLFQTFSGCQIKSPSTPDTDDYTLSSIPRRIVGTANTTYLCPECVAEDYMNVGTPYIHRSHQIPGVMVCYKHGTRLLDRCSYCSCPFERRLELFSVPWQNCVCNHSVQSMSSDIEFDGLEKAIAYAKFCHELLQLSGEELGGELLKEVFKISAIERGFRNNKSVARTELFSAIEDFYGRELLAKMDAAYHKGRISSWFTHILGSTTAEAPLNRYLITAFFLFQKAENFINKVESTKLHMKELEEGRSVESRKGNQRRKRKSSKSVRSDLVVDDKIKQILIQLQDIREEHPEYDLNDFWSNYLGLMKRLVVASTDEFERFRVAIITGEPVVCKSKRKPKKRNTEKYLKLDNESSSEIERIAISMYASPEKPVKVTKNAILKKANLVSRINSQPENYPKSVQKLTEYVESDWHFHARRIIWSKLIVGKSATAYAHIVQPAGINCYRGKALVDYFKKIDVTRKLRTGTVIGILVEYGISRDWQGPCPGKEFVTFGRSYIKKPKDKSRSKEKDSIKKEETLIKQSQGHIDSSRPIQKQATRTN